MSEEQAPAPVVEPEIVPAEAQETLRLGDLRIGYIVGLTEEGKFIFEVVGKDQGLIELMGLQRFADSKISDIFDNSQNRGDKIGKEIGRAVAGLANEIAKLSSLLKKPDNKLK